MIGTTTAAIGTHELEPVREKVPDAQGEQLAAPVARNKAKCAEI